MFRRFCGILIGLVLFGFSAHAAEYYVDGTFGDDNNKGTMEEPFLTVQKAASLDLQPGDIVNVMPGVYYGAVNITARGTADNPITFRAIDGGENVTIITGANKDVRSGKVTWTCHNAEENIWVIDYTVLKNANIDDISPTWLVPARILCDNVDIMAHTNYSSLESGIYEMDDSVMTYTPAYKQGYFYDSIEKKLYIKLRTDGKYGSSNPNEHCIKIAPSMYRYISKSNGWGRSGYRGDAMGRDSYNICVGEYEGDNGTGQAAKPAYVIIDGFTLETPGYAGVFLRSSDVTVRNCYFRGCRTGVRGAARTRIEDKIYSENIIIEHCDWSEFPVYDEASELVSECSDTDETDNRFSEIEAEGYRLSGFYWWQRKNKYPDLSYEVGSFVNNIGENWIIRNNYIHDCFDGLSYRSMQKYQDEYVENDLSYLRDVGCQFVEIYDNVFEKCLDNAIELENHGRNINIHDNYFHNIPDTISWQPENGISWPTNIRIYRNVIHNTRDFNDFWKNKAGVSTDAFKIMIAKAANFDNNYPWMNDYPVDEETGAPLKIDPEDKGVKIFNNTIIMPGGGVIKGGGSGTWGVPNYNFSFKNNVVVSDVYSTTVNEGDSLVNARVYTSAFNGAEFASNVFSPDSLDTYNIVDSFLDNGGKFVFNSENIGFEKITRLTINPELKEGSLLIGAGTMDRYEPSMSRDIGALQYGEKFDISDVGCEQ